VLSQETRLEVMRALLRKGPGGVAAGWLAEAFGVPKPTMSFHLKEMTNAGLVRARRKGRNIIYAPDYGGLRALVDFLLTDCCQGDPRLCGPYVVREETAPPGRQSE
jgi:DNA-binding transcriptional ArsR family regulator